MVEMLERERWQQLAMWEMTTMATGMFNHNKPEAVQAIVNVLREDVMRHLFHKMYDQKVYVRRMRQELDGIRSEKRRLARLDDMTIK
jgi:hypothetical protein